MRDAALMSAGFGITLVSLGLIRELLGQGTLLVGIGPLVNALTLGRVEPSFNGATFELLQPGLVIVSTPAGAFFALAALIVLGRFIARRLAVR